MWSLDKVRNWFGNRYPSEREVDPWIDSLVRIINRLPGCATICSCAGAGPKGSNIKIKHPKNDEPYVLMVCRNVQSMALLLMAFKKVGGKRIVLETIHGTSSFTRAAQEPSIAFYFRDYQELQRFERRLLLLRAEMKAKGSMES